MPAFTYTRLEDGEVVLIGPVILSRTSSFSFSAGGVQHVHISQATSRTVGVTNRRVMIEQGGQSPETQVITNSDVRRIHVQSKPIGAKVEKMETRQGQTMKLELDISPVEEEGLLGLDVPVQEPKRKRITVEVLRQT